MGGGDVDWGLQQKKRWISRKGAKAQNEERFVLVQWHPSFYLDDPLVNFAPLREIFCNGEATNAIIARNCWRGVGRPGGAR